jgi:hypothetical protein
MSGPSRAVVIAVAALAISCGRKGPPLAPLHLVPVAPANMSVARVGDEAQIRFNVPSTNQNGPGPVAIDRIEVFAATVAGGAVRPSNREFLVSKYRIATIAVKPPPVEGEAPPPESTPPDNRPGPGDRTTFVETISEKTLQPVFTTPAPPVPAVAPVVSTATPAGAAAAAAPPAAGAATAAPGAPAEAPVAPPTPSATVPAAAPPSAVAPVPPLPNPTGAIEPVPAVENAVTPAAAESNPPLTTLPGAPTPAPVAPPPAYPSRIYAVRGVAKNGRPGPPSTRVELPLISPPAQPAAPKATATENSIVLTWTASAASGAPIAYNIYKAGSTDPINSAPVAEPKYERAGVTFGTEECFTLRAVQKLGAISLESSSSPSVCLTPRDTFPPAAPTGLSIVAGTGTMNLGWDANKEPDLAGYLILRGEAPGDTLQPLTPAPITATSYEDKTVKPGVRYVYVVIAVDNATPPNRSAPSARVEETAR